MHVLVTFAVDAEFAPWRKLRSFVKEKVAGIPVWHAAIEGTDVTVVLTGIGSPRAREVMVNVMGSSLGTVDACITSGFAGALQPVYRAGAILVPRILRAVVGVRKEAPELATDPALQELAVSRGATLVGRFYTAARVLTTVEEKARVAHLGDAVDMESFAILETARIRGVRGIAIRVISDTADADLPLDFNQTLSSDHQVSIPRVLGALVRKPQALGSLLQFGKQSRQAAESLALFLDGYVAALDQFPLFSKTAEAAAR